MPQYLNRSARRFLRNWTTVMLTALALFPLAPALAGCATSPAPESGARRYPAIMMFIGSG